MASGATSQLRDFGFTLGPAIIGAIALSRAASTIHATVAASPATQKALAGGKTIPLNPIHDIAFHALDHAYRTGFVICGAAAVLSFVLAGVALGELTHNEEPLAEPAPRAVAVGESGATPR